MPESLSEFVADFAAALNAADSRPPIAVSPPSGRTYQAGIGPHPEDRAVDLVVAELNILRPDRPIALRKCYPGSRQTCDLLWPSISKPNVGCAGIVLTSARPPAQDVGNGSGRRAETTITETKIM